MYYPVSALLIEFLILSIVESQDSYGYEISQTVKIAAEIKESTLYPTTIYLWIIPLHPVRNYPSCCLSC